MSYTFGDQQNKLSSLLGDPNSTTDDMFPLTQRNKELNRGELQFAVDAMDIRNYATGIISNQQLAIPSDFVKIFVLIMSTSVSQIVLTNDREISLKDWERYYLYKSDRPWFYRWDYSGTAYYKFLAASNYVNGQTYYLYYFSKPITELVNTTDISLHRDEFQEGPVFYAASQLMQQIGKFTQATQYYQQYQAMVERAKAITGQEYVDAERAVPDFGVKTQVLTDTQGHGYVG